MSWSYRLLLTWGGLVLVLVLWTWQRCFWVLAAAILLAVALALGHRWLSQRGQTTFGWAAAWTAGGIFGGLLFAWYFRRKVARNGADRSGAQRPRWARKLSPGRMR